MSPTFYGVLGVGPDADEAAIRAAYRERVTDVHPDVNDDPEADAQFMRLKAATETLLDESERLRYDRLGHASYVRHHVDCSAWTAGDPTGSSRNGDDPTGSSRTTDSDDPTSGDSPPGEDRGGGSDEHTSTKRVRPGETGPDTATGRARKADGTGGADGSQGTRRATGTADSHENQRTGPSGDTAGRSRPSGYARSSFWHTQRPGERYAPAARESDPFARRLLRGLRAVGLWVVVHVAFLAVAVGTSLYVYVVLAGPRASVPLLLVLVGEVGVAFLLSSVHVISRLVP